MRIKTNLDSLRARRRMAENGKTLTKAIERLSSGQRINHSADDAAGLAISENLRAKIKSLGAAKRNASDSMSYLQVAEGGLNEISNLLIRMRELGSQAASDTIGHKGRTMLDKEFQQLGQEVSRIVNSTEYNSKKVLSSGDADSMRLYIGSSSHSDSSGGESAASDTDPDVIELKFDELKDLEEGLKPIFEGDLAVKPDDESGGAEDLGPDGTEDLFEKLDTAINSVTSYRASLGAIQSRLTSAMTTIDVTGENLSAANSRIRDTDFAEETARLTHARILQQAGAAVIGQANSTAELALALIR